MQPISHLETFKGGISNTPKKIKYNFEYHLVILFMVIIMATAKLMLKGHKVCNNALTTKMFLNQLLEKGVVMSVNLESRKEFEEALKEADIISIGHEDCAQEFNVEAKRLTVHLEYGDVLHVVEANQEDGSRLAIGVTELSQMKGLYFRFIKIEIFEPIVLEKGLQILQKEEDDALAWEMVEMMEM